MRRGPVWIDKYRVLPVLPRLASPTSLPYVREAANASSTIGSGLTVNETVADACAVVIAGRLLLKGAPKEILSLSKWEFAPV